MRTIITTALVLLSLTGCASAPSAYSYEDSMRDSRGFPALDTADYGTDIPRCASDDSNTAHVARCYTERTTDNAVIIVGQDDSTLATLVG